MSVPFKYRQHIRDLHESFHDGKPITEEELMGIMDIIAPAEHQAIIDPYRVQCPLNSNSFLSLVHELQKASQIPYDDLVWNYIRGALKRGIFNGEDRTDLKALRSTLDPLMRAVRLDVPKLYKKHAPPDEEGRITIDQLCDVFRAMYPANQVVYLEMYRWARATKVIKGRGGIGELARAFDDVAPSNAAPASVAVPPPPSAPETPRPKEETTSEMSKGATNANAGDGPSEPASTQPMAPRTHDNEATEGPQEELERPSRLPNEGAKALDGSLLTDHWRKTSEADGEVTKPSDGIQHCDVSETGLFGRTASTASTNPRAKEMVAASLVEEAERSIPLTPSVVSEKKGEHEVAPLTSLPAATRPSPSLNPHDQQGRREGKDVPQPLGAAGVSPVLPPAVGLHPCRDLPPNVQVGRRPGLDFNPPHIRDMEPPARKQKSSTDGDPKASPPPRLRGCEEQPAWEYEEALLDAMLSRVVPGKPVDSQVMEYLRELARQEKELESALRAEMENLTSNMLACEIVEQRMMILRAQRRAQCFDRMESRRSRILGEMEKYLSRVREADGRNKLLLAGAKEGGVVSCRKDGHPSDHDGGNSTRAREKPTEFVSMFTPPPPLLSAERRPRTVRRGLRLGERLQRMQSSSPGAAWARRVSVPQEPHLQTHQPPSCVEPEFPQRSLASHSPGNTSPRGSWAKATAPQQPVPVVHSRPVQHQQQLSARHFGGEDFTILVNSGAPSSMSPLPRQPPSRGVHPHLTAKMAAGVLTSSQLQRKIEERLEARFLKAFQTP